MLDFISLCEQGNGNTIMPSIINGLQPVPARFHTNFEHFSLQHQKNLLLPMLAKGSSLYLIGWNMNC